MVFFFLLLLQFVLFFFFFFFSFFFFSSPSSFIFIFFLFSSLLSFSLSLKAHRGSGVDRFPWKIQVTESMLSGKKNNKYKQFFGIVLEMGGSQVC